MNEEFGFEYEEETSYFNQNQHKTENKNEQKRKRVISEVIEILRSLLTIIDIINANINKKK